MTVVTTTATAPPPVSSMETGKGAAADEGDDGRGHRAAPAVLLLSFPRRRGRRLSFDGISRPSTTATVFPLTAVCVRLARDQNLGLVGQGGRGAFQFMRQMTQSWNFRNIVRLFTNIKYVRTLGGEGVKYPENSAVSVGFDVMVKYGVFLYSPLSPSCDQMRSGKGTERLFPYFAHLLSHWPVADRCHTDDLELFEALITIGSLT